ncbi:SLATT domain-containing protein [Solirubrobacter ginsenosidimutans]|uniref:SLATT domain-containing protein n=1 Tax=Solirubrobacter ginsenosidimutans TaxID=490573 RepID=A0A9X3MU17_9ACTN|nr:SLATT domain-containing protein [Solirubrobacter ginsenosidimutans]MDA0161891.1 SLATT domain-containing protein [Solirubrobacter ginsenosidimutans]
MSGDIARSDLPELDWGAAERAASLSKVYVHAQGLAVASERWYAANRPPKRVAGRVLRVLALLLGTAAALLPILSEIFTTGDKPAFAPGWASVALVIAAALIAVDRYLGASNAWMRYMTAETQIANLRQEFEYAWNIERTRTASPPTDAEVAVLLGLARKLVADVNDVVAAETGTWISDFRGSLQSTEQGLHPPS